jgi:hypothetical protein
LVYKFFSLIYSFIFSASPPSTSERAAGSLAKTLPGLRSAQRRASLIYCLVYTGTNNLSSHINSSEHPRSKTSLAYSLKTKDVSHQNEVLSLIIGSLLSNSYTEKHGLGFRIVFIKCSRNVEYLMKFHSLFANSGYCSNKKPKLSKLVGKGNKVIFIYRFKTYSFSNFD